MRSYSISQRTMRLAKLENIIRLAKWLKVNIEGKTKDQIVDLVVHASNRSNKHYYVLGK